MGELPFGAITAAQWLTTRPVEAGVCTYPADQPTDHNCPPTNQNVFQIFAINGVIAFRAVFVIVSGSDGRAVASLITQTRYVIDLCQWGAKRDISRLRS